MDDFLKEVILICAKMFDSSFRIVADLLQKSPFTTLNNGGLGTLKNIIKPIALGIIAFLFLIEFLKITVRSEILKHEWAFMIFFKFVLAKVAVDVCDILLEDIFNLGIRLIQNIKWDSQLTMTSFVNEKIIPQVGNLGFLDSISFVVISIIPITISVLSILLVIAISFGRVFEMIVHIIIAPIPAACLLLENSRITKKFFLSFGAVVLQGAIILIVFKIFHVLFQEQFSIIIAATSTAGQTASINTGLWIMGLFSIVLVMAIFQSGAWANKILDAN